MHFAKHALTVVVAFLIAAIAASAQVGSGRSNQPKPGGHLSLAVAQRVLNQKVNQTTVDNTLLTCHACYDPDDKGDNDKAPVVSTFSAAMDQFLSEAGYIRAGAGQNVFTAKAKRSKYYNNDGLRFANFRNPRILPGTITDPRHVPVEYDRVPTELTASVFGKVQKIRTTVRFTYEDGAWEVCIGCGQ